MNDNTSYWFTKLFSVSILVIFLIRLIIVYITLYKYIIALHCIVNSSNRIVRSKTGRSLIQPEFLRDPQIDIIKSTAKYNNFACRAVTSTITGKLLPLVGERFVLSLFVLFDFVLVNLLLKHDKNDMHSHDHSFTDLTDQA